jgi:hypothetical protein
LELASLTFAKRWFFPRVGALTLVAIRQGYTFKAPSSHLYGSVSR